MLYFLPSRLVDLVRPAMACLLIVYEVASVHAGVSLRLGCEGGGKWSYSVSVRKRRYYNERINITSSVRPSAYSPPIIDDPPSLWLLRLHHPRRILRTNDSGRDVDVHDGEVVLDLEVFDGDGFSRDAGVLRRG